MLQLCKVGGFLATQAICDLHAELVYAEFLCARLCTKLSSQCCMSTVQDRAMNLLHDLESAAVAANPEAGHPESRRALDATDYPPPGEALTLSSWCHVFAVLLVMSSPSKAV